MNTNHPIVPDRLAPLSEVRERLGIGPTKIFDLLKRGEISAVKIGRKTLVAESELARFTAALPPARGNGKAA